MLLRVISQSIDFHTHHEYIYAFLFVWLALVVCKVGNGVFLDAKAVEQVNRYKELQAQAEYELNRKRLLATKKSKSAPNSPRLSLIDFSGELLGLQHLA